MDQGILTAIVVVVVLLALAALAWYFMQQRQREHLRRRFGPEYDRTVQEYGDTRRAETALKERQERVQRLSIRPLSAGDQKRFADSWRAVQSRFVDEPVEAVRDADRLIQEVMSVRGYPVGDFEERAADISVDHPNVVEHYRAAHIIARRSESEDANTEALRQAMVHYRALFEDLLESTRSSERGEAREARQTEMARDTQDTTERKAA